MIKTKAKDHSQYMRTTHHQLTHIHHVKKPMNDWKKVLIGLGIILIIAIVIIGLALEV